MGAIAEIIKMDVERAKKEFLAALQRNETSNRGGRTILTMYRRQRHCAIALRGIRVSSDNNNSGVD